MLVFSHEVGTHTLGLSRSIYDKPLPATVKKLWSLGFFKMCDIKHHHFYQEGQNNIFRQKNDF